MAETEQNPSLLPGASQPSRRGRGAEAPKDKAEEAVSEMVTYRPGPEGPASIKWRGKMFHANTPVALTDADHIEAARANKYFKVGEFTTADAVPTTNEPPMPKTSEQYRAHFVAWLSRMASVGEYDARWIGEEPLRQACGVGTDDFDWMQSLAAPKIAELRKAGFTS